MTDARPSGVIERPKILLKGAALSVEMLNQLVDLRVETAVSRPAQAVLRFFDEEYAIFDDAKMEIGADVEVSLVDIKDGKAVRLFVGEITSLGVEAGPDDAPITVVTAQDLAHRLGRNSRHRVFANQTYAEMIKKILSENGMQGTVPPMSVTFEHFTQTVDDAAFIDEICRRTGLIWTVDGKRLVLRKPELGTPVVSLARGVTLRRFRAQFDAAEVAESVEVRGWDPKAKKEIVGKSASQPSGLSNSSLVISGRKSSKTFVAKKESVGYVTASVDEANAMAESLHGRSMGDELRVRGEADGEPSIKAGCTIEIDRVGSKLKGKYFVTGAEHVYSGRDYVTRFTCGGPRPTTLADLVGGGQVSGQRFGPMIGLISNIGSDAFAGMVKLKLPSLGDNIESTWARVVTPGGGKQRGLQLMPSIDDEVLVVFENGDLRRPFVLGGAWNPKDAMPLTGFAEGSTVNQWSLKDTSGHALTFRSGSARNKKNVEIALADTQTKLFIGEDKVELWAAQGNTLQLKSGEGSITITADGSIEITGTKVTITGKTDLAAKALNVKINADVGVSVNANTALDLKSSASATLDGGGMATIKGGLVKIN